MSWCNEEYDRLHLAALKEPDQQERHDMYIRMQELWDEAAHTQLDRLPNEVSSPTARPRARNRAGRALRCAWAFRSA